MLPATSKLLPQPVPSFPSDCHSVDEGPSNGLCVSLSYLKRCTNTWKTLRIPWFARPHLPLQNQSPLPLIPASKATILFFKQQTPVLPRIFSGQGCAAPQSSRLAASDPLGLCSGVTALLHSKPKANLLSSSLMGPIIFIQSIFILINHIFIFAIIRSLTTLFILSV